MPSSSEALAGDAGAPQQAPSFERSLPAACEECGCADIVEEWAEGNAVCRGCGLVVAERLLDVSSEWRSFADGEGADRSRVGPAANPLLDDMPATGISRGGAGDDAGFAPRVRSNPKGRDRTLLAAFNRVDQLANRLRVPAAGPRAHEFVAALIRSGARATNAVIAGAVFASCRALGAKRTYREVAAVCTEEVTPGRIGAAVRSLERVHPGARAPVNSQISVDGEMVMRFCNRLQLPRAAFAPAVDLAKSLGENALRGRTPATIASTAIFVLWHVCGQKDKKILQRIETVASIRPSTIIDAYRCAYPHLRELLPSGFDSIHALPAM